MSGWMAEAMWRFVNAWPGKPVGIGLDALDKGAPRMALVQLSGTVVDKRFVDGGFIGRWPFAVRVRVAGDDTAGRLDAVRWLDALWEWMQAAALPGALVIGPGRDALRLSMEALPSQVAAYPDGTEDYQAVFALHYRSAGAAYDAGG